MAVPNNYYVDPASGSDSTGTGTIGNPWSTLQHAIDTITKDTTNGDQINVKAGSADVLSATLSVSSYSPDVSRPLIIRGYTSSANDGGIGEIDGNGGRIAPVGTFAIYIDMKLGNQGSSKLYGMAAYNCEICDSTSTSFGSDIRDYFNCYFHDIARLAISGENLYGCYIEEGDTVPFSQTEAVTLGNTNATISNNILVVKSTGVNGFRTNRESNSFINNTVFSVNASTASGIVLDNTIYSRYSKLANNIVEGFSGTGGKGIYLNNSTNLYWPAIAANSVFDCDTAFYRQGSTLQVSTETGERWIGLTDAAEEELTESPFEKSGAMTFANRESYFKLKSGVGNTINSAWMNNFRGAIAPEVTTSSSGGGSSSGGSSSNTAGTQIYPFRQWVEDDFGGGGSSASVHPLYAN